MWVCVGRFSIERGARERRAVATSKLRPCARRRTGRADGWALVGRGGCVLRNAWGWVGGRFGEEWMVLEMGFVCREMR